MQQGSCLGTHHDLVALVGSLLVLHPVICIMQKGMSVTLLLQCAAWERTAAVHAVMIHPLGLLPRDAMLHAITINILVDELVAP